jgi:hypothetical protein
VKKLLRVLSLALLWICLGGWIGALVLFGLVVAPTAFRVLPSSDVAGQLVGPVLAALNLYGAVAGPGIAGLTLWLRRGWLTALLAASLGLVCLYSHFGVTAEISELRPVALSATPEAGSQSRFAELHQRSVALYAATGLGALVLVLMHARAEAFPRGD